MTSQTLDLIISTLDKMNLLLWQLDLSTTQYHRLNQGPDSLLCADNWRFFSDQNYRKKILHPDDHAALEQALADIAQRRPVQLVFRVTDKGRILWFKLVGWPSADTRYYDGVLEEISSQIQSLKTICAAQQDISPPERPLTEKDKVARQTAIAMLCRDLKTLWSIDAMLESIYAQKELFSSLDAVMYSDIYARKNKVFVYAKGELKEPLNPGSQFAYAGTIAENIAKDHLDYLIVSDTRQSIKAIDWMLFVPKGIYSYIAKACYERGAMRTVLIFCSKQQNRFSEHQLDAISAITDVFHKQLKKIRRQQTKEY